MVSIGYAAVTMDSNDDPVSPKESINKISIKSPQTTSAALSTSPPSVCLLIIALTPTLLSIAEHTAFV